MTFSTPTLTNEENSELTNRAELWILLEIVVTVLIAATVMCFVYVKIQYPKKNPSNSVDTLVKKKFSRWSQPT
jgi:hypothetical protein